MSDPATWPTPEPEGPEINRELRLKLLATMEPYQIASAMRILILNTPELEQIDSAMVDGIDDDPPEPKPAAGKLMIPAVMWTDDERDTPKMIEETLCVLEVALGEYVTKHEAEAMTSTGRDAFRESVTPHIERVARLIAAARK